MRFPCMIRPYLKSDGAIGSYLKSEIAQKADGHTVAILCGGMLTEAVTCQFDRSPVVHVCSLCKEPKVPSIFHVLWECKAFEALRTVGPPDCPVMQRLGWSHSVGSLTMIHQMAQICALECDYREKTRHRAGGGGAPP